MATAARTPTTPENTARINAMHAALQRTVENLASRWADESQYEDIADYKAAIEKALPAGFAVTKMTKRPFGFWFKIGTEAEYAVYCSACEYGWKRVA